jgi:curli biogenesis system outer membrane secretion channel CsgG
MFTTALVRSGQFRVVERARAVEGALRERQLNASEGRADSQPLRGAEYLFEGTISEATASQSQRSSGVSIAGMELGGGGNRDVLSVDVRVVEVASGDVVDAVTVRKAVVSETTGVSGVGSLIGAALPQRGRTSTFVPDVQFQRQRRESVDQALREAIELAVVTLAARLAR